MISKVLALITILLVGSTPASATVQTLTSVAVIAMPGTHSNNLSQAHVVQVPAVQSSLPASCSHNHTGGYTPVLYIDFNDKELLAAALSAQANNQNVTIYYEDDAAEVSVLIDQTKCKIIYIAV